MYYKVKIMNQVEWISNSVTITSSLFNKVGSSDTCPPVPVNWMPIHRRLPFRGALSSLEELLEWEKHSWIFSV